MRILAVIPARGGSKGIPRKNVRLLAGKPLIYYSIHTALACNVITDVAVTTDSVEIADLAEQYGAAVVLRSSALAGDDVTILLSIMRPVRWKHAQVPHTISSSRFSRPRRSCVPRPLHRGWIISLRVHGTLFSVL